MSKTPVKTEGLISQDLLTQPDTYYCLDRSTAGVCGESGNTAYPFSLEVNSFLVCLLCWLCRRTGVHVAFNVAIAANVTIAGSVTSAANVAVAAKLFI